MADVARQLSVTGPYHPPVKRSIGIAGHKTSISLEPVFWDALRQAAERRGMAINALVAQIDEERIASNTPSGLASAIRCWLMTQNEGGGPAKEPPPVD